MSSHLASLAARQSNGLLSLTTTPQAMTPRATISPLEGRFERIHQLVKSDGGGIVTPAAHSFQYSIAGDSE